MTTVKEFFGDGVKYFPDGTQIFALQKEGMQMVLDVRGWGHIQNLFPTEEEAYKFQDAMAEWIVDAINTKLKEWPYSAKTQEQLEIEAEEYVETTYPGQTEKLPNRYIYQLMAEFAFKYNSPVITDLRKQLNGELLQVYLKLLDRSIDKYTDTDEIKQRIAELEKDSKWISVKDRLPTVDKAYDVIWADGEIDYCEWEHDRFSLKNVTHWLEKNEHTDLPEGDKELVEALKRLLAAYTHVELLEEAEYNKAAKQASDTIDKYKTGQIANHAPELPPVTEFLEKKFPSYQTKEWSLNELSWLLTEYKNNITTAEAQSTK
jgi:hypothetical protein